MGSIRIIMAEPITIDNFNSVKIKELALNRDKFGSLIFENSCSKLEKLQNLFKEFGELNYKDNLVPQEIKIIDNKKKEFSDHLNWLNNFDIQRSANPKNEHDSFEQRIDSFYNDVSSNLRQHLTYLRQEFSSKNIDLEELKKQQKSALQAEKAYKELSSKLEGELEILREKKIEVESRHGEIASATLAFQFKRQTEENIVSAKLWLERRNFVYKCLLWIIIANFVLYFALFFGHLGGWPITTKDVFTIEYLAMKIVLLSVLSYGVAFTSKNYNIQSNLASINQHRTNVAQTLEDFLLTNPERKTEMLKQATEAMFKHLPVGYLAKNEAKENGPLLETINNFVRSKE